MEIEKLYTKVLPSYFPFGLKMVDKEGHFFEMIIQNFAYCLTSDSRPILRDISDLKKEIEHNGEKFVPIEKIFKPDLLKILGDSDGVFDTWTNRSDGKVINHPLSLDVWQKFIEWKFNICNLPTELWVDVNNLQINPYK